MNDKTRTIEDLLTNIFNAMGFTSEQREQGFKDFGILVKMKFTQDLLEGLDDSEKNQLKEQVKDKNDKEIQEGISTAIKRHYSEADLTNQNLLSVKYALDEYLQRILKQANPEQKKAISDLVQDLK